MPRKRGEYVNLPGHGKVWTVPQYAKAHGKSVKQATNLIKTIKERLSKLPEEARGIHYDTKPGEAGYPFKFFIPVGTPWCFAKRGTPSWKVEKKKDGEA